MLWQVLFWKKRAEEELQRSGIDYTIVRPGKSPIFDRAHVSCCIGGIGMQYIKRHRSFTLDCQKWSCAV